MIFLASDPEWQRMLADSDRADTRAHEQDQQDRRDDFSPRGRSSAHPAAPGDTRAATTPSWPDGPPLPTVRPDGTPTR